MKNKKIVINYQARN